MAKQERIYDKETIECMQEVALQQLQVGSENAINSMKIAKVLGMDKGHASMIFIATTLLRPLVVDYGIPIGATAKGFFLFRTKEEVSENIQLLENKISGIKKRIRALKKISNFVPSSQEIEAKPKKQKRSRAS